MSCASIEQLAAAATGEGDDALFAHLDACAACQHTLDEQIEMRALLGDAPGGAVLTDRHRESLAAEVMARADLAPHARTRLRPLAGLVIAAAAAAAIAFAFGLRARGEEAVNVVASVPTPVEVVEPDVTSVLDAAVSSEPPASPVVVAPIVAPGVAPGVVPRAKLDGDADYARTLDGEREIVKLGNGALTVDARHAHPVRVVTGETVIDVKKARVKVTADHGVVAQVDVFAGSVEITVAGKTQIIEAGAMWQRPTADESLAAFRSGWQALRSGNNAAAIASFDRANDEVVAEDAMYWAAVASERDHDPAGALTRYRQLLERFPQSTRAKEARAAIDRLK